MKNIILISLLTLLLTACAKPNLNELSKARSEIDLMAKTTIEKLIQENPQIQKEIDESVGYAILNWKLTKVPGVGVGGGNGVLVDTKTGERTYVTVSRFDIGGGWGARSFKNLLITKDQNFFNEVKDGHFKFEAGAEASVGTVGASGNSAALNKKVQSHILIDGGGSATATVRYLDMSLDSDLN